MKAGPTVLPAVQFHSAAPPVVQLLHRPPAPELVAYHQPENAASQAYHELASSVLGPTSRGRALLLSSVAPWSGTTTVLLNLAITAARRDKASVIAVDANLRRPALAERLGLPPGPGLGEVLSRAVLLKQALQETAQPNLRALSAGCCRPAPDSAAILSVVRQLGQLAELIFVDAPSWNEGPEAALLAAGCDALYLVLPLKPGASAPPLPALRQPAENLQGYIVAVR